MRPSIDEAAAASVDPARLRRERRERCFAAMEARGLDVLLLGREANVAYATGARRLWVAGARPFLPTAVVVRASREVHLVSASAMGVPEDLPRAQLHPTTWDAERLAREIAAIPGVREARRVGADGMTPRWAALLSTLLPHAALADGEAAMAAARRVKTADEIASIRAAIGVAEAALAAVAPAIVPGARESDLAALFAGRAAELGATTPSCTAAFCATPRGPGLGDGPAAPGPRLVPSDRPLAAGDLVAASVGVVRDGYEGTLARTFPCKGAGRAGKEASRLHDRTRALLERLLAACRPGAQVLDLRAAWETTGEPPSPVPIALGVGLGLERPAVTSQPSDGDDELLEAGMVVALQTWVWREDVGGVLLREIAQVGEDAAELLTGRDTPAPSGLR